MDVINESEIERMRAADGFTELMFTVLKLDDFVPKDHPLRPIRSWLNDALKHSAAFPRQSGHVICQIFNLIRVWFG